MQRRGNVVVTMTRTTQCSVYRRAHSNDDGDATTTIVVLRLVIGVEVEVAAAVLVNYCVEPYSVW